MNNYTRKIHKDSLYIPKKEGICKNCKYWDGFTLYQNWYEDSWSGEGEWLTIEDTLGVCFCEKASSFFKSRRNNYSCCHHEY